MNWKNTGKEIKEVWRNFSTSQRRNKLKLNKRRTILHQIRYIIIFNADHCILKPVIATQHNTLNFALAAIQITSESFVGHGNSFRFLKYLVSMFSILSVVLFEIVAVCKHSSVSWLNAFEVRKFSKLR